MFKARNVLSTAVAFGLLLGAGTTTSVFAEDGTEVTEGATNTSKIDSFDSDVEVIVDGELIVPMIDVTVPTTATFDIDPFNIGGQGQIVSTKLPFTNNSNVDVDLKLTKYSVEVPTGVTLATAPVVTTSTKKELFLYLDMVAENEVYSATDDKNKIVKAATITGGQSFGTITGVGNEETLKEAGTLELQFYGNVNDKVNWLETDKIKVTPTFKISPVSYKKE